MEASQLRANIPAALQARPHWITWRFAKGRKPPCDGQGAVRDGWRERQLTFEEALAQLEGLPFPVNAPAGGHPNAGLGLVDATGIDCDNAILADGTVDPRAQVVLDLVPGYVERSPSGHGFKIFCKVDPPRWLEINFGADNGIPKPTTKEPNYFAVTGQVLRAGDPEANGTEPIGRIETMFRPDTERKKEDDKPTSTKLADVVPSGSQEQAMFREGARLRRLGWKEGEIAAALWALVVSGRFPNESGREPWTFNDCQEKARSVCRYAPGTTDDFQCDKGGTPKKIQENVRLAMAKLGCEFRHDEFADDYYLLRGGVMTRISDGVVNRLRFESEEAFNVRVPKDLFYDVIHDLANSNGFHPVREYLDSLEWDGVPRLDTWLTVYGGVKATAFTRSVGRIVLMAAVRRVREPGCKFDEILIFESEQGFDKSNALATLCPKQAWFSDSLPLGSDSKVVVERTQGVWLTEAAEMQGYGRREVDHLKAFLSCRIDGPVRLAYGREPVKVPRQFIVIGTTNLEAYLRDTTGNRRFWPVRTGRWDIAALKRDRDQLWAEAAAAEADGGSIRLDEAIWKEASDEQQLRAIADPWQAALYKAIGEKNGKIRNEDLWRVIQLPLERRTQSDEERLGRCMRQLGFKKQTVSTGESEGRVMGWVRGDRHERALINFGGGSDEL